jgi:endonuclease YncB( thermonuclease family)
MKKLLLLLLIVPVLAMAQPRQKPGVTYDAVITRVIDGDTVGIQADFLPAPLKKELSIRVYGVDEQIAPILDRALKMTGIPGSKIIRKHHEL